MTNLKKVSTEVLLYIQKLQNFINSHSDVQQYFGIMENNSEEFLNYATEMAQINYEQSEEPHLTMLQFEEIRQKISPESQKKDVKGIIGIFLSMGNTGMSSLN